MSTKGSLNEQLIKGRATTSSILDSLGENKAPKLTIKGTKKLVEILINEIKTSSGLNMVTQILSILSTNENIIIQLADVSSQGLPLILDKMLLEAVSNKGNGFEQLMLVVVYDLVSLSQKLKSQLCMSIHEYLLSAIEQEKINPDLLSKVMELLVCTITHHQENRLFFVQNTSEDKIEAVFKLIIKSGNPMVQIFSVEFLWRIIVPMKPSDEFKKKLFGEFGNQLCSISANNFRNDILKFIETVNISRTDPDRIVQLEVKKLTIGGNFISGKHIIYIGSNSILIWISKNSTFSLGNNNLELLTIKAENICGFGENEKYWGIGISKDFDTIIDFFTQDERIIFFEPLNQEKEKFTLAQSRFGLFMFNNVPKQKNTKKAITPQARKKNPNQEVLKSKSKTPNSKIKTISRVTNKCEKENKKLSNPVKKKKEPKQIFISSDEPKKAKKESKQNLIISDEPKKPKKEPKHDFIISDEPKKAKKEPNQNLITSDEPKKVKKESKQDLITSDEPRNGILRKVINITSDSSSDFGDLSESTFTKDSKSKENSKTHNYGEILQDDIPVASISESFCIDSDDVLSQPEKETKNDSIHEVALIENNKIKEKYPKRIYTPERWEIETFDELRLLGNTIKNKLTDKKKSLLKTIEDKINESLKDANGFIEKCDEDLAELQTNFVSTSNQVSKEIQQKQEMVLQLGEQQSNQIAQMLNDCVAIQKRAEDLIKKFSKQKKNLFANQEKHINLFKEDIKSEVKTAFSNKKRESSKKIVQKLVTLLDEL